MWWSGLKKARCYNNEVEATRRLLVQCSILPFIASVPGALVFRAGWAQERGQPIYYDADGLIVHKGQDGGDTAQREGWYWFGVWVRNNVLHDPWPIPRRLRFEQVIGLLEPAHDGIFYRHPKLRPWNNPYDKRFGFSRDQMIPLVAAMGVWGLKEPLRRLWNALPQDPVGGTKHSFNGTWKTLFGQRELYTGDIVGPSVINLFRRAWGDDPMRAADGNGRWGEAELATNVGLRLEGVLKDRDDTGNDLNLIVMLLQSLISFPSVVSTRAANLYAKNRLVSYGSFVDAYWRRYGADVLEMGALSATVRRELDNGIGPGGWSTDASRVFGAVRWYHRKGTGANPQLAELYRPIVKAYLE
jgi:hypothetical protein